MAIEPILAMTAAEMRSLSIFPPKIAWMACLFSPYGLGLSNLPQSLPSNSLLIVNDITPVHGHDPVLIAEQLSVCTEALQCRGVLLDFQRSSCEETQTIAEFLVSSLPCPVAVSEYYAAKLDCPVFLPPIPPSVPLEEYIASWKEREIWLELGMDGEILTLTEQGCTATPLPCPDPDVPAFHDSTLHCHYTIETKEKSASFTLWRTKEDLEHLLDTAADLGIRTVIGLFQELSGTGQK